MEDYIQTRRTKSHDDVFDLEKNQQRRLDREAEFGVWREPRPERDLYTRRERYGSRETSPLYRRERDMDRYPRRGIFEPRETSPLYRRTRRDIDNGQKGTRPQTYDEPMGEGRQPYHDYIWHEGGLQRLEDIMGREERPRHQNFVMPNNRRPQGQNMNAPRYWGGTGMRTRDEGRQGQNQGYKRLQMKPEPYDGTEDFETFINHFECCAKIGNWSDDEMAWMLSASLKGQARRFYVPLPPDTKDDYNELVFQLQQRFGTASRHSIYWQTQFENKIRQPGESIQSFVDELMLLAPKAYPQLHVSIQQHLALQQLMKSLEPALKLKLVEMNCQSLRDAEEIIDTYETIMQQGKRSVRLIQEAKEHQGQGEQSKTSSTSGRRQFACFCCGEKSHGLTECPVYRELKEKEERLTNKKFSSGNE